MLNQHRFAVAVDGFGRANAIELFDILYWFIDEFGEAGIKPERPCLLLYPQHLVQFLL